LELDIRKLKHVYNVQKAGAKRRKIDWHFDFEAWLKVWVESGHLHERGKKNGQYCMARNKDIGPYSPENVKIEPIEKNAHDGNYRKVMSAHSREKMSISKKGIHAGSLNPSATLDESDIIEIRSELLKSSGYGVGRGLARKYGVTPQTISKIRKRQRWTHV
jgi:hypothetical protein